MLRGNPRFEAAAGHGDCEGILRVGAASLDALVAEDAFAVIAIIELVIFLDGLPDGGGSRPVRRLVVTRASRVSMARRRARGPEPLRTGPVLIHIGLNLGRG